MWLCVTVSSFYFMALLVLNVRDDIESATDGHAPFIPKRQIQESHTVYTYKSTTRVAVAVAEQEHVTTIRASVTTKGDIEENINGGEIDDMNRSVKIIDTDVSDKKEVTALIEVEYVQEQIESTEDNNENNESPIQKPLHKLNHKMDEMRPEVHNRLRIPHNNHLHESHPKLPPILIQVPNFPDEIKVEKIPKPVIQSRFGLPPPKRKPPETKVVNIAAQKLTDKAQQDYYTVRDTKINAFDFNFISTGVNVCQKGENVFIVMAALTTYYAIKTREAIRETWGSIAKTETWPGIDGAIKGVKLVFLLGNPEGHAVKHAIIKDETERFGDVVVADFTDSYYNLTYKVMMALKWTNEYCPQASYVVKVDEDMFLHVVNLIRFLRTRHDTENGEVIGYMNTIPKVLRTGIWGVPWDVFPFTRFPNYTNGNCYVIGGSAISKMFYAQERMPYIFIEDAFLTGMRYMEGITHKKLHFICIKTMFFCFTLLYCNYQLWYGNSSKRLSI